MSQVIDYENTSLEKLSVFLRQLSRVIEMDRLTSVIDLSDVTLKRVKQIDHGNADISLSGERTLRPITAAGSLAASRDPKMVALNEVIARINSLFAGEFKQGSIEGFVRSAAKPGSPHSWGPRLLCSWLIVSPSGRARIATPTPAGTRSEMPVG